MLVEGLQLDGSFDPVGNNGQRLHTSQVFDHVHNCAGSIQENGLASLKVLGCHGGDLRLGAGVLLGAQHHRNLCLGALHKHRAAVDTLDQPLAFQLRQVTADGGFANIETLGQGGYRGGVLLPQMCQDIFQAFCF